MPATTTKHALSFHSNTRGFTLLEVLIALLVLSIGLLGLAALQTVSLRACEMANQRTTSTLLATDIVERMRANPQGVSNGDYLGDAGAVTGTPPDCNAIDCNTVQLAAFDLGQWQAAVARLPGGQGEITRVDGLPLHTITVRWDEQRNAATGHNCPPREATDLRCFRMVYAP